MTDEREMLMAANRHMETLFNVACVGVGAANVAGLNILMAHGGDSKLLRLVIAAIAFALDVALVLTYANNMRTRQSRRDAFDAYSKQLSETEGDGRHPLGDVRELARHVFGMGDKLKPLFYLCSGIILAAWLVFAAYTVYGSGAR